MRFVAQAMASGAIIETVVVAEEFLSHPLAQAQAERLKGQGVPTLRVSASVFGEWSLMEEPQGIGAVVRQRWETLQGARADAGLCWVALDTIRSAGNLGTIIRTADAAGAAGLLLVGDSIDPYAPEVVRASMGSVFALRYVRTTGDELRAWKKQRGAVFVGTSPHAKKAHTALCYPSPLVLWLGGERTGMNKDAQSLCDHMARIPMLGRADSLNVSVAAGVLLYEVLRQKSG